MKIENNIKITNIYEFEEKRSWIGRLLSLILKIIFIYICLALIGIV